MTLETLLHALADTSETTARLLRELAFELEESSKSRMAEDATPKSALEQAMLIHPSLGPRQRELVGLIAQTGERGANTGELARASKMSQPNVHLTLGHLVPRGLIRKDAGQHPHRYYLGPAIAAHLAYD